MSLHLFEAFGIELEYMIVDRDSLDIRPIADQLLAAVAGAPVAELERANMGWSNELVLHVIEFKTNGPAPRLAGLWSRFAEQVQLANALLTPLNALLMPTAAHPWMDPLRETHLWPHANSPIYQAYNRIFGCRGHGWSNLQSMHINLPFANDAEFARLHAAIRLLMPIMPALCASSPLLEGRPTGFMDARMEVYCHNSKRIPSVAGHIIPEGFYTRQDYETHIMQPMYQDIAPLDPEGVLQHEFLNARGAIARFDRGAIEIRVLDLQECPRVDLAIAALIGGSLKGLTESLWIPLRQQQQWDTRILADILQQTIKNADHAQIHCTDYAHIFGLPGSGPWRAEELWQHIFQTPAIQQSLDSDTRNTLRELLQQGCLARRILKHLNGDYRREHLKEVYSRLCICLTRNQLLAA